MNFRFNGRGLMLAVMIFLWLWLLIWLGFLTRATTQEHSVWLMLTFLPLMIVGYFVLRDLKVGFVWCGFLALGYLAQGITVALTSKSDAGYGAIEVFLSLLLFTAASATLRARRQTI